MSGYLHFTREREDSPAGRILGLLHEAGNAYHSTSDWSEINEWTQKSYHQQIEEMVCRECDALTAERDELREAMDTLMGIDSDCASCSGEGCNCDKLSGLIPTNQGGV